MFVKIKTIRSSHGRCSIKKVALKKSQYSGKTLVMEKLQALRPPILVKRDSNTDLKKPILKTSANSCSWTTEIIKKNITRTATSFNSFYDNGHFLYPLNVFLMFSGGIERDQRHEWVTDALSGRIRFQKTL